MGINFLSFWLCGPSFPYILALWAFISFHFGFLGVSFWGPPQKLRKTVRFPNVPYKEFSGARPGFIFQFLAFCAFISLHFGLVGIHFLSFWPCGHSFPFILALWAFISLYFGLVNRHFFHFGIMGLHFLSFWPCGPSFPFILALWAFISLHFGLVGFYFLAFWLFGVSFWGPPHKLPKTIRFPNVPYKEFSSAKPGSIFQFLAFCAFISFHFGLVGINFLSFWLCGPSFPYILALWAFISFHFGFLGVSFWGPPQKLRKTVRFPNVPYKEFSGDRPGFIFQFLAFCAFISLHFGLVGIHFLSFWPCGHSFPFILALWAFISLYFGLVNRHFFHFGIMGLHFLSFWPCGPSFPFILALWAFISLHFGLVGFYFLAFWLFGVSFWGPPHKLRKKVRSLKKYAKNLSAPGPAPFCNFYLSGH